VLHQIGVGVLGPVYRTYDPDGDRLVAVKVFKLDITPEQAGTLAEQLNRIAQIGLSEPGLVAPLTAGVEDTAAYLAQEYVAAESLDVALRHYAPASIDRAAPFISQLAGAIDGARAVGAQHGALHPRDIFVTPDSARATGFGVVPALEDIGVRGPVRRPYTAPERVGGGEWGPGADIFSLAVIAYELLTGKRPVGTGAEAAAQLREEGVAADADALEALFASALADDPDARPRTAHEFATAFEALGAVGSAAKPAAAESAAGDVQPPAAVPETSGAEPAGASALDAAFEAVEQAEASDLVVEPTVIIDESDAKTEAWDSEAQEPATWIAPEPPAAEPPTSPVVPEAPVAEEPPPVLESAPAPTVDLTAAELPPAGDVAQEAVGAGEAQDAPADATLSVEDDELAAWLASSDAKPRAQSPPSASEVERILSAPEASEVEGEPGSPHASDPAPSQPARSLFDAGGVEAFDPAAPPGEPPFAKGDTTEDQEDVWGIGAADDPPAAEVAPEPEPESEPESEPEPQPEAEVAPVGESEEIGVPASMWSAAAESNDEAAFDEALVELQEEKPSRRAPALPFALALVVAILIAFVAGYVLRSDDPAEPGQAPGGDVAGQGQAPAAAPDAVETPPPVVAAETPPATVPEPADAADAADAGATAAPADTPAAAPEPPPVAVAEAEVAVDEAPGLRADAAPATPAPVVGRLLIRSSPPGAQVVVNEAAAGITPLAMADLAYGDYVIRISRAGYRVELLSVSISADEPVAALNLDLIEASTEAAPATAPTGAAPAPSPDAAAALAGELGSLLIDTRPAGAEVYVDGRLLGATPLTLVDVPTGAHTIRLLRSGYREWTTTVEIESGQQLRVAASLEGAP